LSKYQLALKGYMEELETMEMQIQVTTAAGRQAKEAQDQKVNSLMNLQNSLDGLKATLPSK
jgi:hypothetical protein